jgi:hypothetical protein
MILLKMIYKPFILMFLLIFNFVVTMVKLMAKLGSFFWGLFLWLVIAILIYTALHHQWQEFTIAFCIGFASYLGASAVVAVGLVADQVNAKLVKILAA